MGQYYHAVLERQGKENYSVFQPIVNDEWQGLKLTEHSWMGNDFMSIIAKKIYKKPTRVIWVGDYSEDEELQALNPKFNLDNTYNSKKARGVVSKRINKDILKNKFLVNHDKKVYIDLNRYFLIADEFNKGLDDDGNVDDFWKGWVLNPISLLTAVGNNRGTGDYYDDDRTTCFESVGTWAYNLISLEDKAPVDYTEEKHIVFTERVNDDNRRLVDMYGLNNKVVVGTV